MITPNFNFEKKLLDSGYDFVIGIDEAGRGPLAGPVVACATTVRNIQYPISNIQKNPKSKIQNSKQYKFIRDSKTLSEKQRERLFDFIQEHFYVGVGICDHRTIDRINILEASFLAMKKAVTALANNINNQATRNKKQTISNIQYPISNKIPKFKFQNTKYIIFVDGNKKIPNLSMEQKAIVNGDKLIKSISAASIVAKVTRDRIMREMDKKFPAYQFAKHKGYGTKLHFEMLKKHGPCEIHRRSFQPVRDWKIVDWKTESSLRNWK